MNTAVDTNVLFDVLFADPEHADASEASLTQAVDEGAVIASEVVFAELAASFESQDRLDGYLEATGIRLVRTDVDALRHAGRAWREYSRERQPGTQCPGCGARTARSCEACGSPLRVRQHLVADFLIGAHAVRHAQRLLTRDHRFFRTYFPDLPLL